MAKKIIHAVKSTRQAPKKNKAAIKTRLAPVEAADVIGQSKASFPIKPPLQELTKQALLLQKAPAAALVNSQGDVLYLHGRTGMYLEPAPGEAGISHILKMAREGLRPELSRALHKAVREKETVRCPGLRIKTNGHFTTVNLTVRLVTTSVSSTETPTYLVVLEEAPATDSGQAPLAGAGASTDADALIAALKEELRTKDEHLQFANEELEISYEELKSSYKEMQSLKAEWQSINEKLKISKEELHKGNCELQVKVEGFLRANNDMNNLLSGTGIATVFLDHQLRILRFTPAAAQIINLNHSDMGRPVSHIVSNLKGYDSLIADAQAVLKNLATKEAEVQTQDGRWYMLRIHPYRTLDNVIKGAVMTFSDITKGKRAEETIQKLNKELERRIKESTQELVHISRVAVLGQISAAIAHELNQPLGAILNRASSAQMVLSQSKPDIKKAKSILSRIMEDDRRAASMILKIRNLAKKEAGELAIMDLDVLVRQTVSLINGSATMKGVIMGLRLEPGPKKVRGDKVQLQQVLLNLITNALEAAGQEAEKRIQVCCDGAKDGLVTVSVSDHGLGLNIANAELLFQPFYTTKKEGLGMGLFICRSIIQSHGGMLSAYNNPDGGATFFFSLPLAKDPGGADEIA